MQTKLSQHKLYQITFSTCKAFYITLSDLLIFFAIQLLDKHYQQKKSSFSQKINKYRFDNFMGIACTCLGKAPQKKYQQPIIPLQLPVNIVLMNKKSLNLTLLGITTGVELKRLIYQEHDQQMKPENFVLQYNQTIFTNTQTLAQLGSNPIKLTQRKAEIWEIQGLRSDRNQIESQTGQKGVAYMSCGNYFSRKKMIGIIKQQLKNGAQSIVCPICSQVWPSKQYSMVAGFTIQEINEVNVQLSYNHITSNKNTYNLTGPLCFQDINPQFNDKTGKDSFSNGLVNVSVKLIDGTTKTVVMPVNQTVADLKNQIFKNFRVLRPELTVLEQNKVILKSEQILSSLSKNQTVTQRKAQVWQIKELKSNQAKIDPISCLPGVAIMTPCGHLIGRVSMVEHIKFQLQSGRYQITCPQKKSANDQSICGQLWDKREWRLVAGYTLTELKQIETKLSENMVKANSKPCPNCGCSISNLGNQTKRVRCPKCSNKPDFCFACLSEWKGNDSKCNSSQCLFKLQMITNAPMQRKFMLKKPPSRAQDYVIMAPKYRLCPVCKVNVVQNTVNCKHTPCPCNNLSGTFCFICLGICKNGTWPCGVWSDYCELAPNQRFD